jgi:hypothetical protein
MESGVINKIYDFINGFIHPNELRIHADHRNPQDLKKTCPVTGLDISMQPSNSKFLSYTGVKWYHDNDYETYSKILARRLTNPGKKHHSDDRFREIAHNIRNSDSNPRNNTRRAIHRILKDQNSLFNNLELIDKTKLKEAGFV